MSVDLVAETSSIATAGSAEAPEEGSRRYHFLLILLLRRNSALGNLANIFKPMPTYIAYTSVGYSFKKLCRFLHQLPSWETT